MSKIFNGILMVFGAVTGQWWIFAAGLRGEYQARAQRRAARRARDEYNASLTDRLEMVDLQPNAPRTMPLGRLRYVEGVRRRWVSGTNSEKLTMVVSFGGVQIDGFEQWWLDDKLVSLDSEGWVTDAPYAKVTRTSESLTFVSTGGVQAIQLPQVPVAGSVVASVAFDRFSHEPVVPTSVVGTTATFSGIPAGLPVVVNFQWQQVESKVRIRAYTGAPGQNVGAALAAEYPGKLTASDRFEGIPLAVVDVLYDPDVFTQGRPNVTATLRGARLYDPRKDSTRGGAGSHRLNDPSTWEWSENSALCAGRYATWRHGFDLPADEVHWGDVAWGATVSELQKTFTVRNPDNSTSTRLLFQYQCSLAASSAADPQQTMDAILETMAGRAGWAGGVWRMRAGVMLDSGVVLDETWLATPVQSDGTHDPEPIVRFSSGVSPDGKVNRVTGSCVDRESRWQMMPFPAVEDPTLIAQQGEYATEVVFEGVADIVRAQHLGTVMIRENQASLRAELRCNLKAYRCELFDVLTLLLPRYGMTAELGKTAEVLGWHWHPQEGVRLQLAEISQALFEPVAQLQGRDPAPNSALPAPGFVEELAITGITSGTEALVDGSIVTRVNVQWSPAVADALRKFGRIELQYVLAGLVLESDDWPSQMEGGGATGATVVGLLSGRDYIFRIRGVKPQVGVNGPWSVQKMHRVAAPPAVAAGFTLVPRGQCVVSGRTVEKVGGVNDWDSDAYSAESFAGGAYVAFRPGSSDAYAMVGLNKDPLLDQSYFSLDYAWFLASTAGLQIYASGSPVTDFLGAFSDATRLAIQYDGTAVKFLRDGVVVHTMGAAQGVVPGMVLHMDSSFSGIGSKVHDITFGPIGPGGNSAFNLVGRAQCVVDGNTIQKVGGVGDWDSDAYSVEKFTGGAYVTFRPAATDKSFMLGLNSDPVTDGIYTSLDFAWFIVAGGECQVYENGGPATALGPYDASTRFAIQYDGASVTYLKNGAVVRSVAASAGLTLSLDSSFHTPGAKAVDIAFGPMGPRGPQGTQGTPGQNGANGQTSYFHVAYAESADGTAGFNHVGGTFVGTYVDFTPADSNNPGAYTWRLFKGQPGDQGLPGTNGANGQTSYLHLKYSNDGGTSFTGANGEDPGTWLGQYVDFTAADSNSPAAYTWTKVQGPQGPEGPRGPQGDQGTPGQNGANGQTSYFHVAYAESADGTVGFNQVGGTYVGTYSDFTPADSNSPAAYTWRLFKGQQGEQGIPGTNGANGQTSYLHLKYSDDGGVTFTGNNGENPGGWLGQYVDFTPTDSGSPSTYTWKKIEGVVVTTHVGPLDTTVYEGSIAEPGRAGSYAFTPPRSGTARVTATAELLVYGSVYQLVRTSLVLQAKNAASQLITPVSKFGTLNNGFYSGLAPPDGVNVETPISMGITVPVQAGQTVTFGVLYSDWATINPPYPTNTELANVRIVVELTG